MNIGFSFFLVVFWDYLDTYVEYTFLSFLVLCRLLHEWYEKGISGCLMFSSSHRLVTVQNTNNENMGRCHIGKTNPETPHFLFIDHFLLVERSSVQSFKKIDNLVFEILTCGISSQ